MSERSAAPTAPGFSFFVPVMTPYLREEGLGMARIAGLQTVLLWAMLIAEVPTGVIADRLGHRRSYQIALGMTGCFPFRVRS